jgi:uncharacterized protein (DUF927 family)
LHGAKNVGDFCNQLRVALSRNYGHPIRAFLDRLSIDLCGNNADVFIEQLRGAIGSFMSTYCPNDASGQVRSVCRRFGLIAAAGELASLFGLTGWPGGESTRAAVTCFRDWLGQRGTSGDHDIEVGIRQVIAFIEAHGASRFETVWEENSERVINRAGFRKRDVVRVVDPDIGLGSPAPGGEWQYLILPEAWRNEVCKGYNSAAIAREMANRKMLEPGTDGKISSVVKVPGSGSTRLYVLAKNLIGGA